MFQALKDRLAERRERKKDFLAFRQWQRLPIAEALRKHGHQYFWDDDAPFAAMGEAEKNEHCIRLHVKGMQAVESENPILDARRQLAEAVLAFAPLMVAGLREGKADVEIYADTPYISGQLYPHIEAIAEYLEDLNIFWLENPDLDNESLRSYCTSEASIILFYTNGLNLLSIYLEDRVQAHDEWYRAFVQAAMVVAEDRLREKLGLPRFLGPLDQDIYSSFTDHVISGEPDPFVAWAKAWPDHYLWGHGPKPDLAY